MVFFNRSGYRGEDRFLEIKGVLLLVGIGLGLAGILTRRSWLTYAAIAVLAVGVILRAISRCQEDKQPDDEH